MPSYPLPAAPEEITPAWLTAALRETGILKQAEIAQLVWERIGEGRGLTGVLARGYLQYASALNEENTPSTLIAKFPAISPDMPPPYLAAQQPTSAFQRLYERCAREVWFYQTIAPFGDVPTPRLYYGAADDVSGRVVLLLQDVPVAHAGDVLQGCSPAEAAQVLRAIAPLHARWWMHPRLETFTGLAHWVGDPYARQERYNRQVEPFLKRFGQQLPAFVHDVIDRLRFSYAQVLTSLGAVPQTLIHADLHLDNILFSPSGSASPVTILDWQSVSSGPAVVDVALLIFGSLTPEQRHAAEDELLQEYHALLVERGVSDYDVQRLREHCRLALLWQLAGTVGWLSAVDLDALAGRERALVEAALGDGRLIAALHEVISRRG